MKENLNAKIIVSNNKSNLPSTWTKKKMASLFLISWLSANGVEAGQGFRECLSNIYNASGLEIYENLLNFPFFNDKGIKSGKMLNLCCNTSQCTSGMWNDLECRTEGGDFFKCAKTGQSIFCWGICGGIVGDTPTTGNTTIGNCGVSISGMASAINNTCPIKKGNTYANCVDGCSLEIEKNSLSAFWACSGSSSASKALECRWDNDAWTCLDTITITNYTDFSNYSSPNCLLQWSAPFPGATPDASSASSSDRTIPIVVAVAAGTITVGGIVYYTIRKRKNNSPSQGQELELTTFTRKNLPELPNRALNFPTKNNELVQLVQQIKEKIGDSLVVSLETLLDIQTEIANGNNTFAVRQLQREAKEKLQSKLSMEEIDNLCRLQSEVIRLEIQGTGETFLQAQIQIPPK